VTLFAIVSRREGVAFGSRMTRNIYCTGDSPSAGAASGAASHFGARRVRAGFFTAIALHTYPASVIPAKAGTQENVERRVLRSPGSPLARG